MDRPVAATPPPQARVRLRPDRLARWFLALCVVFSLWLAVSPVRSYLDTQHRAGETHRQLLELQREKRALDVQSNDLQRGDGLEEQARRQGLIDPSERSYVIEDLPQP